MQLEQIFHLNNLRCSPTQIMFSHKHLFTAQRKVHLFSPAQLNIIAFFSFLPSLNELTGIYTIRTILAPVFAFKENLFYGAQKMFCDNPGF